jgi:hypothetical protein
VNQALANPSAYGSKQVQDTYNMLNTQLGQDYDYQRKQLNAELASRGLTDSTIAGNRYSDLATEQARAQSNLATQLATQAAQTYGQDRNAALQAGLGLGNLDLAQQLGVGNLGIAQQNANTQQQSVANQYNLGQGQLGLSAGELTGNYNGQQTLGAQNLDLARLANQQQYGLSSQNLDLQRQLGLGNLGISQGQLDLARTGQQQQNAIDLANLTGSYNGQSTLGAQQLAQQLGIATMQDRTANRNVDVQGALANNDLMLKVAQLLASYGATTPPSQPPPPQSGGTPIPPNPYTGGGGPSGGVDDPNAGQRDAELYRLLASRLGYVQ